MSDNSGKNNPMAAIVWLLIILGACAVAGVFAAVASMALGQ